MQAHDVNIQERDRVSIGKGQRGDITEAGWIVLLAEYLPSMHEAQVQSPTPNKTKYGGACLQSWI